MIRPYNPLYDNVLMPKIGQKHFHFNPSRAPVRNIIAFRGEPSDPFARTFFPRRELRDPDHAAGNDNASASVPGYRYATADAVGFRVRAVHPRWLRHGKKSPP